MFTEKLSIKIAVIVLGIFWLSSCGGLNNGQWSGKISDEAEVGDKNDPSYDHYGSKAYVYRGNDTITLQTVGADSHLYFGKNSPIQDCDITFGFFRFHATIDDRVDSMEYDFKRAEKKYVKGETGLPCRGIVDKAGTMADIEIEEGGVRANYLGSKDETYQVTIYYKPVGSPSSRKPLIYQMLSGRKSWF